MTRTLLFPASKGWAPHLSPSLPPLSLSHIHTHTHTQAKANTTVDVWNMDGFCSLDVYSVPHVSPLEFRHIKLGSAPDNLRKALLHARTCYVSSYNFASQRLLHTACLTSAWLPKKLSNAVIICISAFKVGGEGGNAVVVEYLVEALRYR
jgi:hypothetical protein